MTTQEFKVGDKVQSAEGTGDIDMMRGLWVATIIEVKSPFVRGYDQARCGLAQNESGGCFVTLGHWEPIRDDAGNIDSFWIDNPPTESATARQLWGNQLTRTEG
jgi:hypothetical protein